MEISFRKLLPDDSPQFRTIRLESLKAHPESFGSTFEEQSKLPKLMFEKAIEKPYDDRYVIGAFHKKVLIGICGFVPFALDTFPDMENTGTIIQMYVRSAYRGRKIGLNLVKTVVDEAFKLPDIRQIVLGVREENTSAIRVYERAGFLIFNPVGIDPDDKNIGFRQMIFRRGI
jgi:ribosomal protein S18 acetylase RimI-like enzyme